MHQLLADNLDTLLKVRDRTYIALCAIALITQPEPYTLFKMSYRALVVDEYNSLFYYSPAYNLYNHILGIVIFLDSFCIDSLPTNLWLKYTLKVSTCTVVEWKLHYENQLNELVDIIGCHIQFN